MEGDPLSVKTLCCPAMTVSVLDDEQATQLAARLKALADPVRIRLVSILANAPAGEICACDLPAALGRKQPTISHHLKLLAEAGVIEREQRGKWAWFRLRAGALDELRAALGATGENAGSTEADRTGVCCA